MSFFYLSCTLKVAVSSCGRMLLNAKQVKRLCRVIDIYNLIDGLCPSEKYYQLNSRMNVSCIEHGFVCWLLSPGIIFQFTTS